MLKLNHFSNQILKDISLHLKKGENLIILGKNGAGKSTLAKILCGIYSSPIQLKGKALKKHSPKERTKLMNYVPAKLEIFDEFITLNEYLQLSALYTYIEPKNILKLLSLEKLKNQPCKLLSSGEKQLTMLGAAVLHNAKVTIFDEPTANLDPQKSYDVFSLLKGKLFQQKIIITHDLNLAYALGYDILYIEEGKILFQNNSKIFFKESNLNHFFGTSVIKKENTIQVNFL